MLRLRNLNTTSANIAIQNLSIRVGGLQQPGSVKNISNFVVDIYYSSANDLVASATTSNVIRTTVGSIVVAQVVPGSVVTATGNVLYRFSVTISNGLNNNSKIVITVPASVGLVTGGICTYQSNPTSCSASSNIVNITVPSSIGAGTTISVTYSTFTNPSTTQPSNSFLISTFNAAN